MLANESGSERPDEVGEKDRLGSVGVFDRACLVEFDQLVGDTAGFGQIGFREFGTGRVSGGGAVGKGIVLCSWGAICEDGGMGAGLRASHWWSISFFRLGGSGCAGATPFAAPIEWPRAYHTSSTLLRTASSPRGQSRQFAAGGSPCAAEPSPADLFATHPMNI